MTAASLQWNHDDDDDDDDDDVDFKKEIQCPLAKLSEWLFVVISLNFLWPTISSSSVTGFVRVRVQEIWIISFVTAWLKTNKRFTWIIK